MKKFSLATKAFIIEDGKVLLIKRRLSDVHAPGVWDMPGGRIAMEEDPVDGIKRETREETGLEIDVIMPLGTKHFTRDDGQVVTGISFLCKPKKHGQKIKLSEEHTEYCWEKIETAKNKACSEFMHLFDAWEKIQSGKILE